MRSVWAFPTYGPELGPQCIQTTATNTGLAPVTIDSSSLLIRGRRGSRVAPIGWVHQDPPLPTRLEPGARWTGLAEAEPIKRSLDDHYGARARWLVRPVVGDSTGRAHKATPVAVGWRRVLPRRWMRLA